MAKISSSTKDEFDCIINSVEWSAGSNPAPSAIRLYNIKNYYSKPNGTLCDFENKDIILKVSKSWRSSANFI